MSQRSSGSTAIRELTRILTLATRAAGQLRRLELLARRLGLHVPRPPGVARRERAALDAGASVRQIRAALTALRRQDPGSSSPGGAPG